MRSAAPLSASLQGEGQGEGWPLAPILSPPHNPSPFHEQGNGEKETRKAIRMSPANHPLRPFLAGDTMALRELFAQSVEELTQDDYDEDQRLAWVATAADAEAFQARLAQSLTLVVHTQGEYLGFASLKDNKTIDMLFVHPYHAGQGVGSALLTALEKIAAARGAETLTADVSDTAQEFFEKHGFEATHRNSVPLDEEWLSNTTMSKRLKPAAASTAGPARPQ